MLKFVNLSKKYSEQINSFSCGNNLIDNFLKDKSKAYHEFFTHKSSTKLLMNENNLIGYYTAKIEKFIYGEEEYYTIYLTYIAVDKKYQYNGFGQLLLNTFLKEANKSSKFLGLFGITLKAIPDKIKWYEKNGFIDLKLKVEEDMNLMLIDFTSDEHLEYRDSFDE